MGTVRRQPLLFESACRLLTHTYGLELTQLKEGLGSFVRETPDSTGDISQLLYRPTASSRDVVTVIPVFQHIAIQAILAAPLLHGKQLKVMSDIDDTLYAGCVTVSSGSLLCMVGIDGWNRWICHSGKRLAIQTFPFWS